MSIISVMLSNHPILCYPFLLLTSIFHSISLFPVSLLFTADDQILEFNFSISLSKGYLCLISFRMGRVESLQSKGISRVFSSLLYGPTLSSVHDYWKIHSLTIWSFVRKLTSLLFNTPFRFISAFFLRSKCLLISWLQPPFAVILESKKIRSITVFTFSLFYLAWTYGIICHNLSFLNVDF